MNIGLITAALVSVFAGLFVLRRSWKLPARSVPLVWLGWALIVLSLVLWANVGGHDRGVALGLIVFCFAALAYIGYGAFMDKPSVSKRKQSSSSLRAQSETTSILTYFKRFGVGVWVVFGAGIISFIAALGVHDLMLILGVHASSSLVTGLFLFPILWALFSGFMLIVKRPLWKAGVLTAVAAAGAGLLIIGN